MTTDPGLTQVQAMRFACLVSTALFLAVPAFAAEPLTIPLWEKGAPGFESRKDEKEVRDRVNKDTGEFRTTNVHNPYVTVFLPPKEKATGAAVVVVPGGGHRELWVKHEGENVAEWLRDRGIAGIVLRYRLAREAGSPYKLAEHAPQDGQRALRLVRSKATDWNIKPDRVGMLGFSAGGEVVAMVVGKGDKGNPAAADPIDRQSAKPDFQGLVYSGPLGIRGATVTKELPPTFMVVGDVDGAAAWMLDHFTALRKAGVSSELHVYAKAPHGFGFRPSKVARPADTWPQRFEEFLGVQGMLKKD
jgi:acetyl esterase/lipase